MMMQGSLSLRSGWPQVQRVAGPWPRGDARDGGPVAHGHQPAGGARAPGLRGLSVPQAWLACWLQKRLKGELI